MQKAHEIGHPDQSQDACCQDNWNMTCHFTNWLNTRDNKMRHASIMRALSMYTCTAPNAKVCQHCAHTCDNLASVLAPRGMHGDVHMYKQALRACV